MDSWLVMFRKTVLSNQKANLSVMNPRDIPSNIVIRYFNEAGDVMSSETLTIPGHGLYIY